MLLALSRDLETVAGEDVWQAVDPAARGLVLLEVLEEGVCAGGGDLGFDEAAVGGVDFVPLEEAAGL